MEDKEIRGFILPVAFIKYMIYLIKHKWFVFIECCKLGIPIRGITHDISKFLPDEFVPYMNYFYRKFWDWHTIKHMSNTFPYKWTQQGVAELFDIAWRKHQRRNRHHWQYHIVIKDTGDVIPLGMSVNDVKEMLADWVGAGIAQGHVHTKGRYAETLDYYNRVGNKMIVTESDREFFVNLMTKRGN